MVQGGEAGVVARVDVGALVKQRKQDGVLGDAGGEELDEGRAAAVVDGVDVGAAREEKFGHGCEVVLRGERERRAAFRVAGFEGRGGVDEECGDGGGAGAAAVLDGFEVQRGPAFEAGGVDVGAGGEEDAHDGFRGAVGGVVQRPHVGAVEVEVRQRGAGLEGGGDGVVVVILGADCVVQRGVAVVVRRVDVRAVLEEQLHDALMAVHGGVVERRVRAAAHVADIDIGVGPRQQQAGERRVAAFGSPAEGGGRADVGGGEGLQAGGEGGVEDAGGAEKGGEGWQAEVVGDAQEDVLGQGLELHHRSRDGEKTGSGRTPRRRSQTPSYTECCP